MSEDKVSPDQVNVEKINLEETGILDPDGKNPNPLTGEKYTKEYKNLAKIWSTFPAYELRKEIIELIKNNQVVVITSATGSGKTVLVPKLALHAYEYNAKIGITLPKQIIAKSAASFSAQTLDVELGGYVGYQYRGSPRDAKSNKTKLLYATDGTVVQYLMHDPSLPQFDCIIIDEAHERKVQIDFLLYLLRETLRLRPDFKVIIMSATIDMTLFKNYYTGFSVGDLAIGTKTNYPIQSIFLDKEVDYKEAVNQGFEIVKKIMREDDVSIPGAHDILFFVTSANEAFDICKRLHAHMVVKKINNHRVFCIEVFSGMDPDKQDMAQHKDLYKNKGNYSRKLVVATNVAESSLTIDGIKYVIDTGYELNAFYDPELRAQRLDLKMITQAQAKQRMGRTGRTEPGICYHMYTKSQFDLSMEKFPLPDIRKTDISAECLRLLNNPKIKDVPQLSKTLSQFIEPPKKRYVKDAVLQLMQLGAIEQKQITPLGTLISDLALDPMIALTLIYAEKYDCFGSMLKIISMITACKNHMNELFIMPTVMLKDREDLMADKKKFFRALDVLNEKFDRTRQIFKHHYGDHMSLMIIYKAFNNVMKRSSDDINFIEEWCWDRFLKIGTLFKARHHFEKYKIARQQIQNANLDLPIKQEIMDLSLEDRIMACILMGFPINTAVRSTKLSKKKEITKVKDVVYKTLSAKGLMTPISKASFLTLEKKPPKRVVYTELFILKGKPDLNIVSIISPKIAKLIDQ